MTNRLFNRNFTMVVIGQIISIFGNVILRFTLSLYLLDITGSALIFGSITALSMLPTILMSLFGGMMADRVNKRDIMVVLDFLTSATVLGFGLVLREQQAVVSVALVMVALALIQAFYSPSVTASVPLLQTPENLVKANAVVNQINMVANTVGPILGGVVYGFLGVKPVIFISSLCFFLSAILELFIRIPHKARPSHGSMWATIRADFSESTRFLRWEQPAILKALLLVAGINFFYSALILVGFPYMLRVLLGMSSEVFGVAQGMVAAAGIAGGLITGLCSTRIRAEHLHRYLLVVGASLLPTALCFFIGVPAGSAGVIIVGCTMVSQALACIFSIVAMSIVQRRTPDHLLGKITAYITTLSMCALPIGQALYGLLFDASRDRLYLILLGASLATCLVGISSRGSLRRLAGVEPAPSSSFPSAQDA